MKLLKKEFLGTAFFKNTFGAFRRNIKFFENHETEKTPSYLHNKNRLTFCETFFMPNLLGLKVREQ